MSPHEISQSHRNGFKFYNSSDKENGISSKSIQDCYSNILIFDKTNKNLYLSKNTFKHWIESWENSPLICQESIF